MEPNKLDPNRPIGIQPASLRFRWLGLPTRPSCHAFNGDYFDIRYVYLISLTARVVGWLRVYIRRIWAHLWAITSIPVNFRGYEKIDGQHYHTGNITAMVTNENTVSTIITLLCANPYWVAGVSRGHGRSIPARKVHRWRDNAYLWKCRMEWHSTPVNTMTWFSY